VGVALYDCMLDHHQSGEGWAGLALELRPGAEGPPLALAPHHLRAAGAGVLACQRVVGEGVRAGLEREGVLVLDRLGTAAFSRLQAMVGGRVISSPAARVGSADLGRADTVEQVEVRGRGYLRLHRAGAGLVSLVTGSLGEEPAEELQLSLGKAVAALGELATMARPRVLPGAGCLEAVLGVQAGPGPLRTALLRLALAPGGLSPGEAWQDGRHGHLWREAGGSCLCGLVPRAGAQGLELLPWLEALHQSPGREVAAIAALPDSPVVIDSFGAKRGALLTALETAENLANIGTILYC
jgi:hypothetical protein